jgi:hypothetical protein
MNLSSNEDVHEEHESGDDHGDHEEIEPVDKWTLRQDSTSYRVWQNIILLVCGYSTILYPFYTANEFPTLGSRYLILLLICEAVYFIDIIIKFFLQDLDVDKASKRDDLSSVASRYFYGEFSYDLIAFLPFGLLG